MKFSFQVTRSKLAKVTHENVEFLLSHAKFKPQKVHFTLFLGRLLPIHFPLIIPIVNVLNNFRC